MRYALEEWVARHVSEEEIIAEIRETAARQQAEQLELAERAANSARENRDRMPAEGYTLDALDASRN